MLVIQIEKLGNVCCIFGPFKRLLYLRNLRVHFPTGASLISGSKPMPSLLPGVWSTLELPPRGVCRVVAGRHSGR